MYHRSTGDPPTIAEASRESRASRPRRGPAERSRRSMRSLPTTALNLQRSGDARCLSIAGVSHQLFRLGGARVHARVPAMRPEPAPSEIQARIQPLSHVSAEAPGRLDVNARWTMKTRGLRGQNRQWYRGWGARFRLGGRETTTERGRCRFSGNRGTGATAPHRRVQPRC